MKSNSFFFFSRGSPETLNLEDEFPEIGTLRAPLTFGSKLGGTRPWPGIFNWDISLGLRSRSPKSFTRKSQHGEGDLKIHLGNQPILIIQHSFCWEHPPGSKLNSELTTPNYRRQKKKSHPAAILASTNKLNKLNNTMGVSQQKINNKLRTPKVGWIWGKNVFHTPRCLSSNPDANFRSIGCWVFHFWISSFFRYVQIDFLSLKVPLCRNNYTYI